MSQRDHGYARAKLDRCGCYTCRWAPVGAWDEDTLDDPDAAPDWTGRCGTPGGAEAHRRRGTPTCQACRDVRTAAQRARRERQNTPQAVTT